VAYNFTQRGRIFMGRQKRGMRIALPAWGAPRNARLRMDPASLRKKL